MVTLTQHLVVIVFIVTEVATSLNTEYSKGVKVGKLPSGFGLAGLVSSQSSASVLYYAEGRQITALDKHTAHKLFVVNIPTDPAGAWDSIAVGACGRGDADSCIYLAELSPHATVLKLYRFEEPELRTDEQSSVNSSVVDISPGNFENISIELSPPESTKANNDNIFMLVGDDATVTVLQGSTDDSYYYYQLMSNEWFAHITPTVAARRVNLQQKMVIKSIDWNSDSSRVVVQSSEDKVFLYKSVAEELSPITALEEKRHQVQIKLPKLHVIQAVCWDVFTNTLHTVLLGKHASLFSYKTEEMENYQSDQPNTQHYSRDRGRDTRRNGQLQADRHVCTDGSSMCSAWAESGNCEMSSSREYMAQNCRLSCKLCQKEEPAHAMCQDMRAACSSWAKAGQCNKRPDYMHKKCAASCGLCSKSGGTQSEKIQSDEAPRTRPTVCKDRSEYCSRWAADKKCEKRRDYMYLKCPHSCGLCGNSDSVLEKPQDTCEDKSEYCLVWQAYGYCKAKEKYMRENCPLACKRCTKRTYKEASSRCSDRHDFCETWASHQMCTLKPAYMKENCAQSCGKCKTISNRILYTTISPATQSNRRLTTTRKTEIEGCSDKKSQCSRWAEAGYCKRRADYMTVYCERSCNLCSSQQKGKSQTEVHATTRAPVRQPVTSHPVTTDYTNKGKCEDKKSYCQVWAGAGLCQTRPMVMKPLCPQSCNACQTQHSRERQVTNSRQEVTKPPTTTSAPTTKSRRQGPCQDRSNLCSLWESAGRCSTRGDYMRQNCATTCGFCQIKSKALTAAAAKATCEDKTAFCTSWAREHRCKMYVGYMKNNCAKSCNLCEEKTAVKPDRDRQGCTDDNRHCSKWADNGYCKIRPDFMNRKCRRSCGQC